MPPGLQKKLGPLKVWQWALIGAAVGAFILWKHSQSEETPAEGSGELFGGTGTGAYGAIDPETGVPYAFEGGGGGGAESGGGASSGPNLNEILSDIGQVREMFPTEREPGAETETVIEKEGREAQGEKARTARDTGKHAATSTGAAAAAGGASHHSAPHPSTRIGVGGAHALTGPKAGSKQGGGKTGTAKQAAKPKVTHSKDSGGGNKKQGKQAARKQAQQQKQQQKQQQPPKRKRR